MLNVARIAGMLLALALFTFAGCQQAVHDSLLPAGTPMPPLLVQGWLNGSGPADDDLRGKVVVIDFWAYWCGPCRAAVPKVIDSYNRFEGRDVVFLGLTSEGADTLNESQAFVDSGNIPWPNGYGADVTFDSFGVERIPTLYVIGRDGLVAWHDAMSGTLDSAIEQALSAK